MALEISKTSEQVSAASATAAQVDVSSSIPDPILPAGQNEDELITYFRVRSRNILDERVLAANICAAPGSQTKGFEFARTGIKTAVLAVEWQSWRKGKKPEMPQPNIEGQPIVLMKAEINCDGVEVEGNDSPYFFSSGTYYFAWSDRGQLKMSFPLPTYIAPILQGGPSMLLVQGSEFVPGIINAGW